jgi:hypothetical protein
MSKNEAADFARIVSDLVLDPGARVVLFKPGVVKLIVPRKVTSKRA